MQQMSRSNESKFLDSLITKKSFYFDRVSDGIKKEDPFKDRMVNIWKVKGNKLLRKKGFKNA